MAPPWLRRAAGPAMAAAILIALVGGGAEATRGGTVSPTFATLPTIPDPSTTPVVGNHTDAGSPSTGMSAGLIVVFVLMVLGFSAAVTVVIAILMKKRDLERWGHGQNNPRWHEDNDMATQLLEDDDTMMIFNKGELHDTGDDGNSYVDGLMEA